MNNSNISDKLKKIKYNNKIIISIDYSDLNVNQAHALADFGSSIIRKEALNTVLLLVNVTNTCYNLELVKKIRTTAKEDKPFIKKTALIGVLNMKKIPYNTITIFSNRDMKIFDNITEAKDYLVSDE